MFIQYDEVGCSLDNGANDVVEQAVVEMVSAYTHFVNTRYGGNKWGFKKALPIDKLRRANYYEGFCLIAKRLIDSGRKPEDFISFCFEYWKMFKKRHKLQDDMKSLPGIAFPSLISIAKDKTSLLDTFLSSEKYSPKHFHTKEQENSIWTERVRQFIKLQCSSQGVSSEEFWLNPSNFDLFDVFLLQFVKPFMEKYRERIEDFYGFTIEEVLESLGDLKRSYTPASTSSEVTSMLGVRSGKVLKYGTLVPTRKEKAEQAYVKKARLLGVNVETVEFEESMREFIHAKFSGDVTPDMVLGEFYAQ